MTGNITAIDGGTNDRVAFKTCAPFTKWITHISDEHVDNTNNLDIIMPMYNLIEYSDDYSHTLGSLWQFKRDKQNMNNGNSANVTTAHSSSFRWKLSLVGESTTVDGNRVLKYMKIAAPLKCLSNFWRSLEMLLILCKIHLELNSSKDCVLSAIAATTFDNDNVKLVKLLEEGFKIPVYWNEYQTKIETRNLNNDNITRFPLGAFQGVRRLFVLAFDNTDNGA